MCKKYNGIIASTAARVDSPSKTETDIPKKAIANGIVNIPTNTLALKPR